VLLWALCLRCGFVTSTFAQRWDCDRFSCRSCRGGRCADCFICFERDRWTSEVRRSPFKGWGFGVSRLSRSPRCLHFVDGFWCLHTIFEVRFYPGSGGRYVVPAEVFIQVLTRDAKRAISASKLIGGEFASPDFSAH
jgi:hypothetical protein